MFRSTRKGVTLIEVLVVIGILVVAISFFLPSVRRVRKAAGRTRCSNNLKQLILGFQNFESMGGMQRPTGGSDALLSIGGPAALATHWLPLGCMGPGTTPEERLSWMVALLPYLDQNSLYQQFDVKKGYAGNLSPGQTGIRIFHCPGEKGVATLDATTNYVAMSGIGLDAAWQPAGDLRQWLHGI